MEEIFFNEKRWRYIEGSLNCAVSENGEVRRIIYISKDEATNEEKVVSVRLMAYNVKEGKAVFEAIKGVDKKLLIHELVYKNFIGEYDNSKKVIHIDGNTKNNRYSNLKLINNKDDIEKVKKTRRRPIEPINAYDLAGIYLGEFSSINQAAKALNIPSIKISKVCRGLINSADGIVFEYIKK